MRHSNYGFSEVGMEGQIGLGTVGCRCGLGPVRGSEQDVAGLVSRFRIPGAGPVARFAEGPNVRRCHGFGVLRCVVGVRTDRPDLAETHGSYRLDRHANPCYRCTGLPLGGRSG